MTGVGGSDPRGADLGLGPHGSRVSGRSGSKKTGPRAWTLGFPPAYEVAVRIPGNAKAPGGYAFETRDEAVSYVRRTPEARRYGAYEIELPGAFDACTTATFEVAAAARHQWHTCGDDPTPFMAACGVCLPRSVLLDCRLLTVEARFIDPDTGQPV